MILWQYLYILAVHYVADFILQTHWQATNKSKNNLALSKHVATYTTVLFFASAWGLWPQGGYTFLWFTLINGGLHWCTDWCTSRGTSYYFGKQDWHNGFVVVGADQLIHQITLAVTLWWALS